MVSCEGLRNHVKMGSQLDIKSPTSVFSLVVTERRYTGFSEMSNRYEENNDE
jgi:hypothetical protein